MELNGVIHGDSWTQSPSIINRWKVFLQSYSVEELSIPIKIHSVTWQNPKWLNQMGPWL